MMFLQYHFLIFFIKTYAMGTHLNCLDLSKKNKNSTYDFKTQHNVFIKK